MIFDVIMTWSLSSGSAPRIDAVLCCCCCCCLNSDWGFPFTIGDVTDDVSIEDVADDVFVAFERYASS